MGDARFTSTIRFWIEKLTLVQELILLTGVVLFLIGLITQDPLAKIVALMASGGALAYVIVAVRHLRKREDAEAPDEGEVEREEDLVEGPVPHESIQPGMDESSPEDPIPAAPHDEGVPRMKVSQSDAPYEYTAADFCDLDEQVFARDAGPKSEFGYLVKKALTVIKEVNFAHTAAFFWVNRDKHQLVLENYVTESAQFASHRRREIGSDLISQVAMTGTPRIVNQLNPNSQSESLGYYQNVEAVRSFAGIPIFFPREANATLEPVAVLTLDCKGEDAFGRETMMMLGHFAKLISALIRSYTGKYDLLIDSEVLRSVGRMYAQMKLEFSLHNIVRSLAEEASRLIAWDYITVVTYHESTKNWLVQFVMNRLNDSYVSVGQQIDPAQSLVGGVIQAGSPKVFEDLDNPPLPRFYRAERVDSKGAMLVLPMNSLSRCYGAVIVESKDVKTYSESDIKVLEKLVRVAVSGLEVFALTEVVNNYVLLDETTGVATRKFFMERLHEEVQRAKDFDSPVTLVMTSVDGINDQLNRFGKEGFDFVLQNVGRMVKSSIRHYDLVGRFDFNRFAVLLVNTAPSEAYLWAEKVRRNIASNVINIEEKSFSVTVSVGVCGGVEEASDVELMENANKVLTKAIEAGGNMVRVF
jgi:diguanylate cyclase (GGDEF)-like protein